MRVGTCELRKDDASGLPLTLCDLAAGGGPGGGGGSGIPGSQPGFCGDWLLDWLVALDVLALPTVGPAETARLEFGGRLKSSFWTAAFG